MKTKHIIYMAAALTLSLVSCQQEEFKGMAGDGTMSFSVLSPNALSRVADESFEQGDQIGLYVTDYINAETPAPLQISGNRANNEVATFDGASWSTERAIYWGAGKSDVYAYYPYMAEVKDVTNQPFSVATDQSAEGAYEASDLLWAKAEGVVQTDGAVSLQMQHAMSRLVVKIMAGEEYIGSLPKDATVHLHSTVTDARISLANGSVVKDPYGGAHSILMRNRGIHTFAEGEAVVYEAIVVPQMLETSVPLLEINSKSVSYLLEDMFNFKPGVSYTYTAILNASTTSIKVEIGCEIEDWNNIGGSEGDGGGSEGGEDDGIDLSTYTDLSAEGTANCYLVKAAGKYKFKAVLGNSNATVGNVKKTEVLWESFGTDVQPNAGDLIASTGYKNGYVYFSTPENFKNGNASIAVRNSKDVILWSWHIWCSEEGWTDQVYANNAGTMMDRNLGATSATPGDVGAFGLLYQWGRKDPFLGGGTLDSKAVNAASTGTWNTVSVQKTIDFTEENPMTYIANAGFTEWCTGTGGYDSDYTQRWMESKKTMYDPCPVGYRVPDGGENGFWATALEFPTTIEWDNYGFYWALADGTTFAWYPFVGYRSCSNGVLTSITQNGCCWSASPNRNSGSYNFNFSLNNINPANDFYYQRTYGLSVRCVKE